MNRVFHREARRLPLLLAFVVLLSLGGTAALAGQLPAAIPTVDSPPPTPPPNDNFANATVISSLPFNDTVDATWATTESGEPQYCDSSNNTVWYRFIPDHDMVVGASTGQYETVLTAYQAHGPTIGDLSEISCGSWNPSIHFQVQAGVTYYLQVGTIYYYSPGSLQLTVVQLPPPANDNFASAKVIGSLPFSEDMDITYATTEPGEPAPSCSQPIYRTVWYAFTPETSGSVTTWLDGYAQVTAVYTGAALDQLTEIACRSFWWGGQRLTFHADAGNTYYIQTGRQWDEGGWRTFYLEVAPPPVASFGFSPGDPTVVDTVQFFNESHDPDGVGIQTSAWIFGDRATSSDWSPSHRYGQDGDYTVQLTVTTPDGRSASTTRAVHVETHDVAIVKIAAPQTAHSGQTKPILVEMRNTRYPENVQVDLYKSNPTGWVWLGGNQQSVPVRNGNRTTAVSFSYTFTADDARMGKVTFRAVATIVDKRDVWPADNEAVSTPSKVSK